MATKKGTRRPATMRPATRRRERQQRVSRRLRSLAVSLTVNDLGRSLAWYRDVLRFTVGGRWQEGGQLRGVQLKAGSCDLMLNEDDFAKGRARKKGDGMRTWVWSAQEIEALAAGTTDRGGRMARRTQDIHCGARA